MWLTTLVAAAVASVADPVLYEKPEEFVAQFKFTGLLLPSGNTARITQGPPLPAAESENKVEDEALLELLAISTEKKKKDKKKNKKKGGGGGEDGDAVDVQ